MTAPSTCNRCNAPLTSGVETRLTLEANAAGRLRWMSAWSICETCQQAIKERVFDGKMPL